jgi:hypothetical protein
LVKLSPQHQDILASLIAREQDGSLNSAVFSDLPIEVYHHPQCPGVSSTRIKDIVARNYNYARRATFTPTPAMEFGTKFHEWMGRPYRFFEEVHDRVHGNRLWPQLLLAR